MLKISARIGGLLSALSVVALVAGSARSW